MSLATASARCPDVNLLMPALHLHRLGRVPTYLAAPHPSPSSSLSLASPPSPLAHVFPLILNLAQASSFAPSFSRTYFGSLERHQLVPLERVALKGLSTDLITSISHCPNFRFYLSFPFLIAAMPPSPPICLVPAAVCLGLYWANFCFVLLVVLLSSLAILAA